MSRMRGGLAAVMDGWYASRMRSGPEIRLRPAKDLDAPALSRLWAEAFPGEPRADVRLQALLEGTGPYGGLETCWVAEQGSTFVGGLRSYALRMHLWGHVLQVQGVASVAVLPEARRRGVGRSICERALRAGLESGAVLSALYPFRADFYRRIGYALVGELHRYRFRAADLPELAGHEQVRRLSRNEAARLLPATYWKVLQSSNGLVERTPEMWRSLLAEDVRIYGVNGDGPGLRGYLIASAEEEGTADQATLSVRELLALDSTAHRAFWAWLSTQRNEWHQILYDALPGEEVHLLLPHPRLPDSPSARGLWFPSATVLRGPMVRILDLRLALQLAGLGPGDVVRVSDDQLPENSGSWIGTADGPKRAKGGESEPGTLSIAQVTERFVAGRLPGQSDRMPTWKPVLGVSDFRLLDVF